MSEFVRIFEKTRIDILRLKIVQFVVEVAANEQRFAVLQTRNVLVRAYICKPRIDLLHFKIVQFVVEIAANEQRFVVLQTRKRAV